jgi:hypothetical protein
MAMLQDVRAVGMAALQLPRVLRQRECGTPRYLAECNARYPMLLVPGYAATDSVWTPLRRALGQAGFGHIVSLSYNSFATDPVAVSAELTHQALQTFAARPLRKFTWSATASAALSSGARSRRALRSD